MKITVNRFLENGISTISRVLIDGIDHGFKGLEDAYHKQKIYGKTRIPAGVYPLKTQLSGHIHTRYSQRFPKIHKGVLNIANVPSYTGVMIHIGNTATDTEGCLLIGKSYILTNGEYMLQNSTGAYLDFYERIIDQVIAGNVSIEFIDNNTGLTQ